MWLFSIICINIILTRQVCGESVFESFKKFEGITSQIQDDVLHIRKHIFSDFGETADVTKLENIIEELMAMHEQLRSIRKSFDSVTEEESIPETPEDIRRRLLSFGEIAITNTEIEYITIDSGQVAFREANIQNIGLGDVNIANCTIPNVNIPNAVDIGVVAASHIDIDHIRLNRDIAIENIALHSGDIYLQSVTIE